MPDATVLFRLFRIQYLGTASSPEVSCNLMLDLARLVPEKTRSSTGQPVNDSFVYLSSLNKCNMDFQLVAGRPDTIDPLVFITTFEHNNVFYKAALAETISWEGLLTGTYDVLLQSAKGTQRLTLVKEAGHWRAGEEVEQIGVIRQDIVDLLGEAIGKVSK
jgi:hypothetical protein